MEVIWTKDGDISAMRNAIWLCYKLDRTLPKWAASAVLQMQSIYHGKRGRRGSPDAVTEAVKNDFQRWGMVDAILGLNGGRAKPLTLKSACEHVANSVLKSQNVTPRAVEDSYRRVKRKYGNTLK